MNKAELAVKLSEKMGLPKKKAEEIIEAITEQITTELQANNEVTIAGFGTWSARVRASRMGVNPQNPSERIQIPEVRVPKFKAGKTLKDALKKKV
jgi:nucleoid DNA-binding protein